MPQTSTCRIPSGSRARGEASDQLVRMDCRGAAEQARDQAVVVAPVVRRLEVDHARERDDAADRELGPRSGPERQVTAGGVPRERDAVEVERVARGELGQGRERRLDVVEGAGPAAAGVAEAPVLDVPRREAVRSETTHRCPAWVRL